MNTWLAAAALVCGRIVYDVARSNVLQDGKAGVVVLVLGAGYLVLFVLYLTIFGGIVVVGYGS